MLKKPSKKSVITYLISLCISAIGFVLIPVIIATTPIGQGLDNFKLDVVMVSFVVVASLIWGTSDIKTGLRLAFPFINGLLYFLSVYILSNIGKETSGLTLHAGDYYLISLGCVCLGQVLKYVKETIKKKK